MNLLERYFFGEVHGPRAFLLSRGLLLLLAFDVWVNMISHGGRYGVGGFNLAHFDWLDSLLPIPSPGLYIATLSVAASAAFVAAFVGLRLWLVIAAAVAMNASWSMSLLDSYQHHYLIGLLLVCVVGFVPKDQRTEMDEKRTIWGFPLVCAVMAVVYFFAAISKLDDPWLTGQIVQSIAGARAEPLLAYWTELGGIPDEFWSLAGRGTVVAEFFLCAAFLVAPLADRGSRVARVVSVLGFVVACALHGGVEWVGLSIDWFSYYLFLVAFSCFAPQFAFAWLAPIGRKFTAAFNRYREWATRDAPFAVLGILAALAVAVAAVAVDLPGVAPVGAAVAIALIVLVVVRSGDSTRRVGVVGLFPTAGLCALVMLAVIDVSEVRFEYYRFVGGDAFRRAQRHDALDERRALLEASLDAYQKANRYAPEDDDRRAKELRVRAALEKLPPGPATGLKEK